MLWADHGIRPADVEAAEPELVDELVDYLLERSAGGEDPVAGELRRRLEASP